MAVSSMGPYLERLLSLFLDGYDKQSLRELLLFKMDQNLANEVAEGESFRTIVFNLLVKALMEGWLLQLAREARDLRRALKPDWVVVVDELQVALPQVMVQPALGSVAVPRGKDPPEDLKAVIQRYDAARRDDQATVSVSEDDLATRMAAFPLEEYSLVDYFLLSNSPGGRLAAVLALNRTPQVQYLYWLSERIAVESPFVGLRSAGALLQAARTLPIADLDSVAQAASFAIRWIAGTISPTGHPEHLGRSLEVAKRTLELLSEAIDWVNRRTTGKF